MSSLNDSEEQTSPPATPGSLGVHVANSHFSNIKARRGNNGCLQREQQISVSALKNIRGVIEVYLCEFKNFSTTYFNTYLIRHFRGR